MGPYCKYCNHRCFVPNPRKPGHLLATCPEGKEFDTFILGYCWRDVQDEVKISLR